MRIKLGSTETLFGGYSIFTFHPTYFEIKEILISLKNKI